MHRLDRAGLGLLAAGIGLSLTNVVSEALGRGLTIRPIRTILQAILEAGGAARGAAALVEASRRALRRQIAQRVAAGGELPALLLDPAAEVRLREGLQGELAAIPPELLSGMLAAIAQGVAEEPAAPVIVAAPDLRRAVRQLVSGRFPAVPVLSWEELPPELPVRPLGRVPAATA